MASAAASDVGARIGVKILALLAAAAALVIFATGATATGSPTPPAGVSGVALDTHVELAWQPVAGATGYTVYRGATATTITTRLTTAAGIAGTTFTDTGLTNGTAYFYAVRSVTAGVESPSSLVVQAKPVARSCASGNAVVLENCFPGTGGWQLNAPADPATTGIEGFATQESIAQGQAIDLKINTKAAAPYSIQIYRSGYYTGWGARLYSTIQGLSGVAQPACASDATTGLMDCSNWSTSATITTTSSWPSGVYLARLVRTDTGADSQILFVVRDDARHSKLLYGVPFSTYEAYNNWGGKSLYDYNSSGANTVAGSQRAVKVSFDRPFAQGNGVSSNDWYPKTDYTMVFWLERSGYDVAYQSVTDMELSGQRVSDHTAYILGVHDEYYSAAMRAALEQARDAGVSLFNTGADAVSWKIRYENSAGGATNRVEVCYKTWTGGPVDPSGISTSAWRDPAGPNQPENALLGVQYTGDNSQAFFPLKISAAEGTDRVYRYTGLGTAPASIGQTMVGWEWDTRFANGFEPAGVKTLATSTTSGNVIQPNGTYVVGAATSMSVKYTAPSGALVFSTGANQWVRGLAVNGEGVGEPDVRIQQTATNVLADMSVLPQTPASNISFDSPPPPPAPAQLVATAQGSSSISLSWGAVAGAAGYDVYRATSPRAGGLPLGTKVNTSQLTTTTFVDTGLSAATKYYYVVTASARGVASPASNEASATTAALPPPTVVSTAPASGATGVAPAVTVRATFSRALDPASVTSSTFTLRNSSGQPVAATVAYDAASTSATLDPTASLAYLTTYTARLDGTIRGSDGTQMGTATTWSFTTAGAPPPPTITARTPAAGATGVPRTTSVTATFSKAMVASSFTTATFTLRDAGGTAVAATISYNASTLTATLVPTAQLTAGAAYTARVDGSVAATDGSTLTTASSWTFTAAGCPCSLFSVADQPVSQPSGTYELGVKIQVDTTMTMSAIRYYKASGETGSHTGSVWTASGLKLAQVTFSGETASGWQQQALTSPLTLQAGSVYVISVNANSAFAQTRSGLATSVRSGPIFTVADGANGVFNTVPGSFPNATYQSSNYYVDVVASTGAAPFNVTQTTPAANATDFVLDGVKAQFSQAVDTSTLTTSTFTLRNSGGTLVAGTVSYDAATQTAELLPSQPLTGGAMYTARLETSVKSSSGTPLAAPFSWSFTVSSCPCSFFSNLVQPASQPSGTYELGVKLKVDVPTTLTSLRYYKAAGETGAHVGTVWTSGGIKLAQVAFTGETASGWQVQPLGTPLQLQPGSVYVVSVNANSVFAQTRTGLATAVDAGPLHTIADGANGVFNPVPGSFPTDSYQSSNYFVDVVATLGAVPFSVSQTTPADGSVAFVTNGVRATFSRAADPVTVTSANFTLRDASGTLVPASVSYDSASNTAALTPTGSLTTGAVYTALVGTGVHASDGTSLAAAVSWSFTVAGCPCSLFPSSAEPVSLPAGTFELGVKLKSDIPAHISAIRFYKAPGETGTHTGSVWSATGTLLGQVTFTGETASGWQQQALASPVALTAGAVYVVSVNANANFAQTRGGLTAAVDFGPLHTIADGANGVFDSVRGSFPTDTYQSSNYYVDVVVTAP